MNNACSSARDVCLGPRFPGFTPLCPPEYCPEPAAAVAPPASVPHVATVQHAGATIYVLGEFVAGDTGVPVNTLLDTGASGTLVHQRVVSKLGVMHEMYPATRLGVTGPVSAVCNQLGLLGAVEWIKICGNSLCSRRIT